MTIEPPVPPDLFRTRDFALGDISYLTVILLAVCAVTAVFFTSTTTAAPVVVEVAASAG